MKATSPKLRVAQMASLVSSASSFEVRGTRVKGRFGGHYLAEVSGDGQVLARFRHRDWRKAYKGLEMELSRMGIV